MDQNATRGVKKCQQELIKMPQGGLKSVTRNKPKCGKGGEVKKCHQEYRQYATKGVKKRHQEWTKMPQGGQKVSPGMDQYATRGLKSVTRNGPNATRGLKSVTRNGPKCHKGVKKHHQEWTKCNKGVKKKSPRIDQNATRESKVSPGFDRMLQGG